MCASNINTYTLICLIQTAFLKFPAASPLNPYHIASGDNILVGLVVPYFGICGYFIIAERAIL